jgi:hypothetical protein
MWKILVAFILFAAVGLFVLKKMGGGMDVMSGESHAIDTGHAASAPSASSAASAAPASASAASN